VSIPRESVHSEGECPFRGRVSIPRESVPSEVECPFRGRVSLPRERSSRGPPSLSEFPPSDIKRVRVSPRVTKARVSRGERLSLRGVPSFNDPSERESPSGSAYPSTLESMVRESPQSCMGDFLGQRGPPSLLERLSASESTPASEGHPPPTAEP
jgi:hypothetical protein